MGIIGGTGSGKSTIINLMMRFYDPQKGNIFVDGKNIKSYELPSLRRLFGVVFQNDFIFHDTISSNIKMGRNISDEDMKKAAENAMAAEFIERYEEGYEHYSAIHGAAFSGGQKQRLLISRALSGDSPVIVLDDSSSALDYHTDSMVRKNILSNHKSSSLVIVAERVSAVMNADEILVLHNGEIIGRGRHDHLMESCDEYRDIYQTQMGEARE